MDIRTTQNTLINLKDNFALTPSISYTTVTRGATLYDKGNDKVYQLVRIEGPVSDTDANGRPIGNTKYRFNLLNLSTGKMRVSDSDRMLINTNDLRVNLQTLRDHFGLDLCVASDGPITKPAADTVITVADSQRRAARMLEEANARSIRHTYTTPSHRSLESKIDQILNLIEGGSVYFG